MIIDQLNVFFDDVQATPDMESKTLSFSPYAGRNIPVYIAILAKGDTTGDFSIEIQQSSDNATFSTVETVAMSKPDTTPLITSIQVPLHVKEQYVRLKVTGSVNGLTLFAGITRDRLLPYDKGLYIDKGEVVA